MICRIALESRSANCKHKLANLLTLLKAKTNKLSGYGEEIRLAMYVHENYSELDDATLHASCVLAEDLISIMDKE